ncbi:unnamed protein product [Camellia sinensis]
MGSSESTLSSSQRADDEISTVSSQSEVVDPLLEKLRSLKIDSRLKVMVRFIRSIERNLLEVVQDVGFEEATPILTAPLEEETSLTDILVRKPSSSSASVNPMVLLELFSMYRDWQEAKIQTISKKQEEVENKIEVADALTEVHALQVDLGELKGRLTEVISNCDSLCKRINAEGPESLRSSVKPFSVTSADLETSCRSHGKSVK